MRVCTCCGVEKEDEDFSFRKNGQPERKARCKLCANDRATRYYHANRAHYLALAQAYRKDPTVRAQINRRRNALRRQQPEVELFRLARVRARMKCLPFSITEADIRIPEKCPVLGIPLIWGQGKRQKDCSPTLDRITPGLGYVPGNVMVISWRANRIKSDATIAELEAVLTYFRSALETRP